MPDTKADTASKVSNVKRLENELAEARETAKTQILAVIGEHISQLEQLGVFYSVAEVKKLGRPKKGGEDGLA